jgi:undecaprenyl diphosphate synthase
MNPYEFPAHRSQSGIHAKADDGWRDELDLIQRQGRLPRHVAVIMDGNGRWAQARGQDRCDGHKAGAESVRTVTRTARELGIETLTLYAFSAQNWARPAREVAALMQLLADYATHELPELRRTGVRLVVAGDLARLPLPARLALDAAMRATADLRGMTLCLCLSYGGREELVAAAKKLAERVQSGRLQPHAIDEATLERELWTAQLASAPDLVIRTSGENRLSNFLLWQSAYAELYFTDVAWPAFREPEFAAALLDYAHRQRRFGGLSDPLVRG